MEEFANVERESVSAGRRGWAGLPLSRFGAHPFPQCRGDRLQRRLIGATALRRVARRRSSAAIRSRFGIAPIRISERLDQQTRPAPRDLQALHVAFDCPATGCRSKRQRLDPFPLLVGMFGERNHSLRGPVRASKRLARGYQRRHAQKSRPA